MVGRLSLAKNAKALHRPTISTLFPTLTLTISYRERPYLPRNPAIQQGSENDPFKNLTIGQG